MSAAGPDAPTIYADGICKNYGRTRVLDGIEISVSRGEFVSLLGPSGSGKTTFLMVLAGFVFPDSGRLFFGTESVVAKPPHLRNLGMVFQSHALFPHLSVFENVAFPLRVRRLDRGTITRKVRDALALVRLETLSDRRVSQLSGGQSQRVALARAIVFEPSILLMDEPLSALDKQLREHMQVEIRSLHEQVGLTTVYVTHDQREAFTMSDRVAVLDHGRIVQIDAPSALYEKPANMFVAGFVGESSFLPVSFGSVGPHAAGIPLRASRIPTAASLMLVLRPEKLVLGPPEACDETMNLFPGTVQRSTFQGDSVMVQVRLDAGKDILIRQTPRMGGGTRLAQSGDRVGVRLHPDDVVLVPKS
jgi:putative spermidine/putrescine transport system ATP-binding protein